MVNQGCGIKVKGLLKSYLNAKCEMRDAKCEMRDAKCEMRNAKLSHRKLRLIQEEPAGRVRKNSLIQPTISLIRFFPSEL